jgi:hypothetical protein
MPFTPRGADKPALITDILSFVQSGIELSEAEIEALGQLAMSSHAPQTNPDNLQMLTHVSDSSSVGDMLGMMSLATNTSLPPIPECPAANQSLPIPRSTAPQPTVDTSIPGLSEALISKLVEEPPDPLNTA